MEDIVGIRYVEAGPIAYCSPGGLDLGIGDYVVVTTDRGEQLGWVVLTPDQVVNATIDGPVRVVDRIAAAEDVEAYQEQKRRGEEDVGRAQELATRNDPRMRVASIRYDLAGTHGDLTFTGRDQTDTEWFRREASRLLGADLEVRQVGDRDRAKAIGGLGQCGRALCCATWQTEFPAISIKMAKEQGLAPNPSKISGVCGRLLCCLSFEVDQYREIAGTLPKVGKRVSTPIGRAKVLSINAVTEIVRLRLDETGEVVEIPGSTLRQQYGTAVRPADLEEQIEAPLHRQDEQRRESLLAMIEPVDAPTATMVPLTALQQPAPAAGEQDEDQPKRRRRRGRRGGRRRRGGGGSGSKE